MNLCFSRTAVILMLICIPLCNTNAQNTIDQERLLKQQQSRIERQINEHEMQKKIEKSKVETLFEAPKESEGEEFVQGKCFQLKEIIFKNDTILSKRTKKKLTEGFIGKCINQELLQSIVRNVTNHYVRKGYITTRAFINPQDIHTGKLEVLIIEGKVDDVVLDGKPKGFFTQTQVLSAFGNIEGKYLNIRNIEQGLEQLNRLPSNNATMKIVPSKETGYSHIVVARNKQSRTTRLRVGANNAGQEQTGMYNGRIMLEQDNLLKVNDSIIAVFSHDLDNSKNPDGSSTRGNNNIYTNINLPFGMWNVSSSFVSSSYLSTIKGTNDIIKTSGESSFQNYKLERKVFRNQTSKVGVFTSLQLKDTKSFIEDVVNDSGSRKLSVLSFGINHSLTSKYGYLDYTVSYFQGIRQFGAKEDKGTFDEFTPKAQYKKYTFDVSYYKPFKIKNQSFYFQSFLSSQYSQNPLFASEQIIIGDQYSVRGFREKSSLGDSGFYINNNLTFMLPQMNIPYIHTNKTELFLGYDYGYVKQKGGRTASFGEGKGILSGIASGIRFKGKLLQFDVTYARTLKTESYIPQGYEVYANLMMRVW